MRGQICPTALSLQPEVPVVNPRYEGATPEMDGVRLAAAQAS